jgi:hypothetical protein
MRAAGDREALLDVNVDNPTAAGLYASLGFTVVGRRARFERGGPVGTGSTTATTRPLHPPAVPPSRADDPSRAGRSAQWSHDDGAGHG